MITGKINVEKIDKSKLFKGRKGTYLNVVLIPTPKSDYGDYMIKMDQSKEDRESGAEGVILGNAKDFQVTPQGGPSPSATGEDDNLPF